MQLSPALCSIDPMEQGIREILDKVHTIPSLDRSMNPEFVCCDSEEDTLTVRYQVLPWMVSHDNQIHRGLLTAMADDTMGVLADYSAGGPGTPTISMEVNYLGSASVGETMLFTSQLCSLSPQMIHMSITCRLESAPDTKILTGTGIYYRPDAKH